MPRRIGTLLSLCAIIALLLTQTTSAAMFRNTIDPDVTMQANGRILNVGGPIGCDAGERLWVRITVTQSSTGALAEGYTNLTCTGDVVEWSVQAATRGAARFEEGPAEACALGKTRLGNTITDIRQWCAANDVVIRFE